MSMELLTDYIVPCVLCEEPLEHVTINLDRETGSQSSTRQRLPHLCHQMQALKGERRG